MSISELVPFGIYICRPLISLRWLPFISSPQNSKEHLWNEGYAKKRLFLFPTHFRSKGTRPVRSVKHFFTDHDIILGSFSLSCKLLLWVRFPSFWWMSHSNCGILQSVSLRKLHLAVVEGSWSPLPAAYLQAVANFSYDVSEIQYLIQYPQGELPNFFITPLFWTHVALKSKWKTSGLEADSYLGTSRVILIMNNHW